MENLNNRYKFRAWVENKGMFYFTIDELLRSTVHSEGVTYSGGDMCYIWERGKKMQYTGLKDKNGKEIFEGDVVKGKRGETFESDVIGVVEYGALAFAFVGRVTSNDERQINEKWFFTITNPDITKCDFVEVIGNIYENPDLLPN